jgi:hypothetical protein
VERHSLFTRSFRGAVILAFGSWVLLFALLLIGFQASRENPAPYYFINLFLALIGILGCIGHLLLWRYWRVMLLAASALYLALYFLRFFGRLVWWQLEFSSLPVAIWNTLELEGRLVSKQITEGWLLAGISTVSFEWLVPTMQLVVFVILAWPLTRRSNGTR